MKFSKEHLKSLQWSIELNCMPIIRSKGMSNLSEWIAHARTEFSETRVLWDIFFASKWSRTEHYNSSNYNDSHIETAMRHIIKQMP